MLTQNLGFPRIGANRELKKACEAYWKNEISLSELLDAGKIEKLKNWNFQQEQGIDLIPSNDFSFYDQVADLAFMLDVIPNRFHSLKSNLSKTDLYFALCRGYQNNGFDVAPLEMTKWFDTNYHYLVPEFTIDQNFKFNNTKIVDEFIEAKEMGIHTKPVLIGPVSFLKLGKEKHSDFNKLILIDKLLPAYIEIIKKLKTAGATYIQIDEPFLATDLNNDEIKIYKRILHSLFNNISEIDFILTSYFEGIEEHVDWLKDLPIKILHLDLIRAPKQLDCFLDRLPNTITLSLGIIDGRNIWKNDFENSLSIINKAIDKIGSHRIILAASCSLLHVPYSVNYEDSNKGIPEIVKNNLSFAKEKIKELHILNQLANYKNNSSVKATLLNNKEERLKCKSFNVFNNEEVISKTIEINALKTSIKRSLNFEERINLQKHDLKLPLFPTTLIGSLPQTKEIRQKRNLYKNKKLTSSEYQSFIKHEIKKAILWQEEIGLDILVHGEFERNDMVEFFGEQLNGITFTLNGWVQSYGSRGVKPPIIYGDISRKKQMTVELAKYAQSLTNKPVKGMLTGPITILQWSFVRTDQPRKITAEQLALAIREEVIDLENAGIKIIQIDEPALREGLPLKNYKKNEYLQWAVNCFKLCHWGVMDQTQIHSHMCYADFNDIMEAIINMDADVISIETSRSQMEVLDAFKSINYPNQMGPGVYDIHSPRIPSVEEMCDLLYTASHYISIENLWINPDCGLKTRNWNEIDLSIKNMVSAAKLIRSAIHTPTLSN